MTWWAALAAAVLLLAGCGQTYEVKVDAIRDPEARVGYGYRIEPLDPNKGTDDINYARAEQYVKAALSARGMYEAPDPEDAEVVVAIDYGTGLPRTEYREVDRSLEAEQAAKLGMIMGGPSAYPGRPVAIVSGSRSIEAERVVDKYLTIVAREARPAEGEDKPGRELWRVNVVVEDDEEGMAEVLPVLVGAATDYLGTDTTEAQEVFINDRDEVVEFVKKGL